MTQALSMLHLPSELIYEVMKWLVPATVFNMRATCRAFYDISVPYVYKEHTLALVCRVDVKELMAFSDDNEEEYTAFYRACARAGSTHLQEHILFISSSPDILRHIQRLSLDNRWTKSLIRSLKWPEDGWTNFIEPIMNMMGDVIRMMPNLREVQLVDIVTTFNIMHAILSAPHMNLLSLQGCALRPDDRLPRSHSIRNLVLNDSSSMSGQALQSTLHYLPNLRWTLFANWSQATRLQDNFFSPLERLHIHEPDEFCLNGPWLDVLRTSARLNGGLHLTHFKISCELPGDDVFSLIEALSSAPLRHLSLEGVWSSGRDTIERIASTFPDLISLTIVLWLPLGQARANLWLDLTWVYAQIFTNFNQLKHFGWNYRIAAEASPSTMLHFEDGWSHNEIDSTSALFFEDDECVPKLFASFCRTLGSMYFIHNPGPPSDGVLFKITRNLKDVVEISNAGRYGDIYEEQIMNARTPVSTWPTIP